MTGVQTCALPICSSPVQANHLAFSYWPSERVLAIPVNERRRAPGSEAAVYLYDVSLPSKLRLRGVIRRAAEPTRTRESGASGARIEPREPELERVLLIDGRVFSVARDRIQVHTLADLSHPVADIRLL